MTSGFSLCKALKVLVNDEYVYCDSHVDTLVTVCQTSAKVLSLEGSYRWGV